MKLSLFSSVLLLLVCTEAVLGNPALTWINSLQSSVKKLAVGRALGHRLSK